MNTFFWHDYETFGTDPARDRPVQFAGIRTDEALQPVGEPLEIFCRPTNDYLPDPSACLITGITPQQALAQGVPEPEFIARIHDELARPGTCGVGYNSIRFDDEVTRYTLYRNFYDPYAREWQAGNSRWDLIDVMRMCYALRPGEIEWPRNSDGLVSFRLERLTAANGIEHSGAHDALADVRATIALAALLRRCQPKMYQYALSLRDKRVAEQLLEAHREQPLLHISSRYPAARGCAALVLPIARHPTNRNAVVVADLAQDPQALLTLDADQLRRRLFTPLAELKPGEERIAVKQVHVNRSPMLVTPRVLQPDGFERLGIDPERCQRHASRILAAGPQLADKLVRVFGEPAVPADDPETQLYAGFIGGADRRLLEQVRRAEPPGLASLAPRFSDPRLAPLLFRYRARHYPATLTADERREWRGWCRHRLAEPALANGRGLVQYLAMIEDKLSDSSLLEQQRSVLLELRGYGRDLAAQHELSELTESAR